jgi:hypothetical protein
VHLFPQLPQLNGSSYGLTHLPSQQRRSLPHEPAIEGSHAPASAPPPDDEPPLEPPELPPEALPLDPPLDEPPWDPLLDPLVMPPEPPEVPPDPLLLAVPEPLPLPLLVPPPEEPFDPPLLPPLVLPPDALPEPSPDELPPEPPLEPPPLVDDPVASTEASLDWIENSVPPQRAPANTTASNAKYLRLPRFMAHPSLQEWAEPGPKSSGSWLARAPRA